jgi:predicted nucleic acid-binding protein
MRDFFLDTSFVLALELKDERHHQAAKSYWQSMAKASPRLITTSYVFDEVVTFFNSRSRHDKAVVVGDRLLNSKITNLIQVDEKLFLQAWQYFQYHRDKSYSLTDCISFLVMKQMKIQTALTLDKHFSQAGFEIAPSVD